MKRLDGQFLTLSGHFSGRLLWFGASAVWSGCWFLPCAAKSMSICTNRKLPAPTKPRDLAKKNPTKEPKAKRNFEYGLMGYPLRDIFTCSERH